MKHKHEHWHFPKLWPECATREQASTILALLEKIMSKAKEIDDKLSAAFDSLANLTDDVKALLANATDGLSAEEAAAALEKVTALSDALDAAKDIYKPEA